MMQRINVYMDDDLWLRFRKQCLNERRSASSALSQLVLQSLATADGVDTRPATLASAKPHPSPSMLPARQKLPRE